METAQLNSLQQWVQQQLQAHAIDTHGDLQLTPLNGDAGFRRYFRLNTARPLLAVLAPPATEDSAAFVAIARYLREQSVVTPQILGVELEQGWLLLEDLGQTLLSEVLLAERSSAEQMYGVALMTLLRLQQCPTMTIPAADGEGMHTVPSYTAARLGSEMALFHEWFATRLLGYSLSAAEHELLEGVYLQLESAALQQPQVWVHRDYHCRNLICREGQPHGVIDFQDAVRGPITYDLVSLLRDCYIRWPREQVEKWALAYGDMAVAAGLMAPVTQRGFLRWFDLMGLQRHLKVLGVFARLWLRDGKPGYLRDLPLVIRYTLEVADSYPELRDFAYWFREKLLPLCEQQDWYCDYSTAGDDVGEPVA